MKEQDRNLEYFDDLDKLESLIVLALLACDNGQL